MHADCVQTPGTLGPWQQARTGAGMADNMKPLVAAGAAQRRRLASTRGHPCVDEVGPLQRQLLCGARTLGAAHAILSSARTVEAAVILNQVRLRCWPPQLCVSGTQPRDGCVTGADPALNQEMHIARTIALGTCAIYMHTE